MKNIASPFSVNNVMFITKLLTVFDYNTHRAKNIFKCMKVLYINVFVTSFEIYLEIRIDNE